MVNHRCTLRNLTPVGESWFIIPLGQEMDYVNQKPMDPLTIEIYLPSVSENIQIEDEDCEPVSVSYARHGNQLLVEIGATPWDIEVDSDGGTDPISPNRRSGIGSFPGCIWIAGSTGWTIWHKPGSGFEVVMMNEFDLVIHGGLLVSDSGSQKADLGIQDGKIAAVGLNLSGKEVLDASGLMVIPGGVDPHVHLNMPTATTITSEDWYSGTLAAAHGGTTTVLDFVEPLPGQSLQEALQARQAEAEGRHGWITVYI